MTDKKEIKDGLVEEFYDNGQLELRRNYKNGKEDGLEEEAIQTMLDSGATLTADDD
jgi:antitoxin component YwqK of YwqJK toxin-antitoxin module